MTINFASSFWWEGIWIGFRFFNFFRKNAKKNKYFYNVQKNPSTEWPLSKFEKETYFYIFTNKTKKITKYFWKQNYGLLWRLMFPALQRHFFFLLWISIHEHRRKSIQSIVQHRSKMISNRRNSYFLSSTESCTFPHEIAQLRVVRASKKVQERYFLYKIGT